MSLPRHDPPGFVTDLTSDEDKQAWSDLISSFMLTENVSPSLTPQFYDAAKVPEQNVLPAAKITWIGFPKQVKLAKPNDQARWKAADAQRNVQDEYLEWSVARDATTGKITRVVFCNEGPEYYEFLGQYQPDVLVSLYQTLNPGADIQKEDLFIGENYNPQNKWNNATTTGTIAHLIQPANTLGAELDLGARATVLRKDANGNLITDSDQLIKCSQYGNPNRNSDPTIGAAVNGLARQHAMITIQNPVGLYIDSVNWAVISPPVGHEDDDPSTFWKWTRGVPGFYMRGEFEVPADKGYVLGDLTVNGNQLQYASQIADYIKVSLTGRACAAGVNVPPRFCSEPPPPNNASDDVLAETSPHHPKHKHHHQSYTNLAANKHTWLSDHKHIRKA